VKARGGGAWGLGAVTWVRAVGANDVVALGQVLARGLAEAPSAVFEPDELGRDPEAIGRDAVRSARIEGSVLLLAEVGVTPVAMARVTARDLAYQLHVATAVVCVDPAWRGQGVGRALLEAAERRAFGELGVERLEVRVASDDEALRRLAERRGFRRERVERQGLRRDGVLKDLAYYVKSR